MWFFYKNKIDKITNIDELEQKHKDSTERLELEKGDKAAIFLGALMVFGPLLLLMIGILLMLSYCSIH